MANDLEQVAIELEARVGRYKPELIDAANVTERQLARIERSATSMERQVGRSFGAAAQQSRLLGYQISDIGVQLSAGTSPFLVLAQQGPQVANALEGARGAVGRFATFLSGPYGAAVLAATTLLGVWLSKNKEAGESVQDLVEKLRERARQEDLNRQASDAFNRTLEGQIKLQRELTAEIDKQLKSQRELNREKLSAAITRGDELEQQAANLQRELASARIAAARARERVTNPQAGTDPEAMAALAVAAARAEQKVEALEKRLRQTADALRAQAELIRKSNIPVADERVDASLDASVAATQRYTDALASLRAEYAKGAIAEAEYIKRKTVLERKLREAEKAARAEQKATSSLPPVTGQEIARALGTRITSGTRTPAENAAARGAKNSYHLSGQAIDIPLTVNGKPLTKAGIRAALEPLGIEIKELLGPGDKGHGDHFHIAFSKKRRGSDEVARSAQQSADTEERRRQTFENELAQLLGDEIAAKRALVESAEEIAKLRIAEIETERQAYDDNLTSLVVQRKLSDAEAAQLRGINDERAKLRTELVKRNEQVRAFRMEEAERERDARLNSVQRSDAAEVLRGQSGLARTLDERNEIERRLVDLQYAEEKARNDYIIGFNERLKLQKGIAQSELAEAEAAAAAAQLRNNSIGQRRGADLEMIGRNDPLSRYIDEVSDTKTRVQQAMVYQLREVSDGISESLTKELGIKSRFVRDLFSIFLDEAVFRPLAEALRNGNSGGGGLFGTIIGAAKGLFGSGLYTGKNTGVSFSQFASGRASGGHVNAGQLYRINEASSPGNPEYFRPANSGTVIPLGQINQSATQPAQAGGVATVRLELSGDLDARIDQRSASVAVEVVRVTSPTVIQGAVQETQRRMSRPRMPGAGR